MSYNPSPPLPGEIVVVPLAHPNGAYIRREDNTKIPVLAKVRSGFSETVNVVNFFGYTYNVPLAHIERINYDLDTSFYTQMIDRAQKVMDSFGYPILDNSGFYDTSYGANSNSYSFLAHLPGFSQGSNRSYIISPAPSNQGYLYQTDPNPHTPPIIVIKNAPNNRDPRSREDSDDQGSIRVMDIDEAATLHVINRIGRDSILFDKRSGVLVIPGYGTFIIDTSFTYAKTGETIEYVILRSLKNYIHVRKSKVNYVNVRDTDIDDRKNNLAQYDVRTIRPKSSKPKDKRYFEIMKIIGNEFN